MDRVSRRCQRVRPPPASGHRRRYAAVPRQAGVAIITALLVVALAAILVSGLLWRQEVQIRRIENQRLINQAQWITRSALDWTRLIIRSAADSSPSVTYLGGVWARADRGNATLRFSR